MCTCTAHMHKQRTMSGRCMAGEGLLLLATDTTRKWVHDYRYPHKRIACGVHVGSRAAGERERERKRLEQLVSRRSATQRC